MVRSCHQLMEQYLANTCPAAGLKAPDWSRRALPVCSMQSPVGAVTRGRGTAAPAAQSSRRLPVRGSDPPHRIYRNLR